MREMGTARLALVPDAVRVDASTARLMEARGRAEAAERLLRALGAIGTARETLDQLEGLQIALARAEGCSWQEIGTALGVTRQAAMMRWSGVMERIQAEAREERV